MGSWTQRLDHLVERLIGLAEVWFPKLVLAIVTLIVGLWLIRVANRISERALAKSHVDPTVRSFLKSLASIALKVMLFISVASTVGIATTSFVAVIGAAGLAIGLALQGSLSNFAGGVLILLLKPFRVGDAIQAQGHSGSVNAILIFHTEVTTPDNRVVIIPNGKLYNDVIINFSNQPTRRVDVTLGVGYEANLAEVRRVLLGAASQLPGVLSKPAPVAEVVGFAEGSMQLAVRVWAKQADVGPLSSLLHESVKVALDEAKVPLPPPRNLRV